MPYHLTNFKRFALVLFLGGCFLWTKRDRLHHLLCNESVANNTMVEFGPLPMMPDVPLIPDFPKTEELLLPEQQELIEQQLQLRDDLLKELKEKTDRIRID
jgi:hypothetical protein